MTAVVNLHPALVWDLKALIAELRCHAGVAAKADIAGLTPILARAAPHPDYPNGDDCAALATTAGFDLFAMEGFINRFVDQDPWFAGWCGVMVNASDIAAMGGRAVAVVNALWSSGAGKAEDILEGMAAASRTYGIPIVGGHTNLTSNQPQLAVAVLGRAKRLLSSFAAQPGQAIIAAIDLRGAYREPFLNWNAATSAPPGRLRADLEVLPRLAEAGLASAAKDISQAGLLGTLTMLMESAQLGAEVNLTAVPKPAEVSWSNWLRSFPSFGFLLTVDPERVDGVLERFACRDIAAAQIGQMTNSRCLWVNSNGQRELFWDLNRHALTGLR